MKLRESERQALELEAIQYRNRILELTADMCNIVRDQNEQLKAEIAELHVANRWLMEQLRDSQRSEDALEDEAREARDHERGVVSDERRGDGGSLATASVAPLAAADGADEELM